MDKNIKVLILKIIKFNGNISPLIKLGYEYSQVAQLIKDEILEENAIRKNGILFLTPKGNDLINQLTKELKRTKSDVWIEPELASKIIPINKNEVFLPNQNDLSF